MSQTTVETILETIGRSAKETAEACLSAANARKQEALAREEKRLQDELAHSKKEQFDHIRTLAGKNICAAEAKARAGLFHHRETIRKEIMQQVKEQVIAFTNTPAYETFLIEAAKKIRLAMQGQCAVLNMRECDRNYAAAVSAHLGHSITLHIDPAIELGGITVISTQGDMLIDFTLDSRLEQQNIWFTEHSGLTIE